MANYQAIARLRPEVRDFIRNRRWVYRGETVGYGGNTQCSNFSTDERGFRHSVFKGKTMSVADCARQKRYGLVLGSSHLYGFGLAGNENTIPSLLADEFDFPFANVSIPEANSRNLHSLLNAIVRTSDGMPSVVVHMSGGDFTSFCFSSIADPIFGSPNLKQLEIVLAERLGTPSPDAYMQALLAFNGFWTKMIVQLCRSREIPVLLASDTTFFEKKAPSELERQCRLGVPSGPAQDRQFTTHKALFGRFCAHREAVAGRLGAPFAGPGPSNELTFIDEFHYDRGGTRGLARDYIPAIAKLL